jgi:hypothetical protein
VRGHRIVQALHRLPAPQPLLTTGPFDRGELLAHPHPVRIGGEHPERERAHRDRADGQPSRPCRGGQRGGQLGQRPCRRLARRGSRQHVACAARAGEAGRRTVSRFEQHDVGPGVEQEAAQHVRVTRDPGVHDSHRQPGRNADEGSGQAAVDVDVDRAWLVAEPGDLTGQRAGRG